MVPALAACTGLLMAPGKQAEDPVSPGMSFWCLGHLAAIQARSWQPQDHPPYSAEKGPPCKSKLAVRLVMLLPTPKNVPAGGGVLPGQPEHDRPHERRDWHAAAAARWRPQLRQVRLAVV